MSSGSFLTASFVWSAVVRFRWRAAGFFVVAVALVLAAIILAPRQYASESRLFLRVGRESVSLDPTATTGQMIGLNDTRQSEVNSALELLKSRGLREKVVDRLGPGFFLDSPAEAAAATSASSSQASSSAVSRTWSALMDALENVNLRDPVDRRERAVARLGASMEAWVPRTTHTIAVTCRADTPHRAQQAVETMVEVFREEHVRANRTGGSHGFFAEQSASLKDELERRVDELREKKSRYGLLSVAGQRGILEQRQGTVQQELATVAAQHAASQAKLDALSATVARLPPREVTDHVAGLPNAAADTMRQQLYDLEIREEELSAKLTDEHPELIAVRQQLAQARRIFDEQAPSREQMTTAPSPTYQPLQQAMLAEAAEAKAWNARLTSIEAEQERLASQIRELTTQEVEIQRLEREIALLEADYRSYAERREQSRIDQVLADQRISNVNVVQEATLVQKPVSPKKLLSLLAGMAAGLLGGIALAVLSAIREQPSTSSVEQVDPAFDLPVLLTVPRMQHAPVVMGAGQNDDDT